MDNKKPVEMGEQELRMHAKCTLCGEGIGHTGLPLFWRVTVERFGVDLAAAKRQDGLAAAVGSALIARVLGPDEVMAFAVMDPCVATICETCANEPQHLGFIIEAAQNAQAAAASKTKANPGT